MWELKSYCLDTVPLFADHTGTNLSEALQEVFSDWGLTDNIKYCAIPSEVKSKMSLEKY